MGFLQKKFAVKRTMNSEMDDESYEDGEIEPMTDETANQRNDDFELSTGLSCDNTAEQNKSFPGNEPETEILPKIVSVVSESLKTNKRFSAAKDPRIGQALDLLKTGLSENLDNIKDNFSIYGEYVGNKLKEYPERTNAIVQQRINTILLRVEMEQFVTPPPKKDICVVFGQYVENKLVKYSVNTSNTVRHLINGIMNQADAGEFEAQAIQVKTVSTFTEHIVRQLRDLKSKRTISIAQHFISEVLFLADMGQIETHAATIENCHLFCENLVQRLLYYTNRTQATVQQYISNVLFQADLGQYEPLSQTQSWSILLPVSCGTQLPNIVSQPSYVNYKPILPKPVILPVHTLTTVPSNCSVANEKSASTFHQEISIKTEVCDS